MKELTYSFIDELKHQYADNKFNFYQHVVGNIIAIVHNKNDIYSDADFAQLQFDLISEFNENYPDYDVFFLNEKDLHLYPGLIFVSTLKKNIEFWASDIKNTPKYFQFWDVSSDCSNEVTYAIAA